MKNNNTEAGLESIIRSLEYKMAEDGRELKEQMSGILNSIKPVNILKSTLNELGSSSELNPKLFNVALGMAAGYLAKRIFVRRSRNPIRKLFGAAIMMGVTSAVNRNPELVKRMGALFLGLIRKARAQRGQVH